MTANDQVTGSLLPKGKLHALLPLTHSATAQVTPLKNVHKILRMLCTSPLPITGDFSWQLQTGISLHQALWRSDAMKVAFLYDQEPVGIHHIRTQLRRHDIEVVSIFSAGWGNRLINFPTILSNEPLNLVHYHDIGNDLAHTLTNRAPTCWTLEGIVKFLEQLSILGHMYVFSQKSGPIITADIWFREMVVYTWGQALEKLHCTPFMEPGFAPDALRKLAFEDYQAFRSYFFDRKFP